MPSGRSSDNLTKSIRIAVMILIIVWGIPTLIGVIAKLSVEVWKDERKTAPLEQEKLEQVPSDGGTKYSEGFTARR